ncbi:MAG: hypothetical protein EAZ74_01345 [Alphaproteobacteria bacterium]|nr:MAG: hypothetical protein EAY76_06270 [Alphaproteobacteria bacterium]TAF15656.1 MAG: hypothetical protein EAZ74_01345 [Alphaproteobacteria bacterium]TAF41093.1 MAG: hypothetical protein EAZ66_01945 [Alphaproteobacteria bacterium]TAF76181.1 MAG: hypothetical protein EAZ52_04590 [Alphaproteobacteria bacterium]
MLTESEVPIVEFGDQKVPNEARLILLAQMNAGVIPKEPKVAQFLADSLARDGYEPQKVANYVNIMVEEEKNRGGGMLQAWLPPESSLAQAWMTRAEEHANDVMTPEDQLRAKASLSNSGLLAQLAVEFPELTGLFDTMGGKITSREQVKELESKAEASDITMGQALIGGAWVSVSQQDQAISPQDKTQELAQERTLQMQQQAQLAEEANLEPKPSIARELMADIGDNFAKSTKALGIANLGKDEPQPALANADAPSSLSSIKIENLDLKTFRESVGYDPNVSVFEIQSSAVPLSEEKMRENSKKQSAGIV